MNNHGDAFSGSRGIKTTALAPKAPMKNWPSAPIFHNRMRKAREHARPTSIKGVAFTNVSEKTPILPTEARAICAYDANGSPPTIAINIPPIINATTIAAPDTAHGYHRGGSVKRSSN